MNLTEINKIADVLKEDADKKSKALELFRKKMDDKFSGDCWLEFQLKANEKMEYENLKHDAYESRKIYNSFINNDWYWR